MRKLSVPSHFLSSLVLLLLGASATASSPSPPQVGAPAPPLSIDQLLQAPDGASADWEALRGKVVVLEFWATWCAPCIAAIPHLNELAEQFRDQDVVFIAITAEAEPVVAKFLQRRPIDGWIGLDADKSMQSAYDVTGIPRTFLVDRDGTLIGSTHPTLLKPDHLEAALAGRAVSFPESKELVVAEGPAAGEAAQAALPEPLVRVLIRPAADPDAGTSTSTGAREILMTSADASSLFRLAYGINRLEWETDEPEGKFDVAVNVPAGRWKHLRPALQEAIAAAFGLRAVAVQREMDVLILETTPATREKLSPTASTGGKSSSTGPRHMSFVNCTLEELTRTLELRLDCPVVNESTLEGGFDFEVKYDSTDDRAVIPAMEEQLGLTLKPARRTVKVWVVRPVE